MFVRECVYVVLGSRINSDRSCGIICTVCARACAIQMNSSDPEKESGDNVATAAVLGLYCFNNNVYKNIVYPANAGNRKIFLWKR